MVVFAAATLRGFGGFGFSMAAGPVLALLYPPTASIPLTLSREAVACPPALLRVWTLVQRGRLAGLTGGALLGMPAGLLVVHLVAVGPLGAFFGGVVLVTVLVLWCMPSAPSHPSNAAVLATGVASGFLNGAAGMSGPPVILMLSRSTVGADATRATMAVYFSVIAAATLAVGLGTGVYVAPPWQTLLLMVVPLILGTEVGTILLKYASAALRRPVTLAALLVFSLPPLLDYLFS